MRLKAIPSQRFELLIPTFYVDRDSQRHEPIQPLDIITRVKKIADEIGGFTMANPNAPPHFAGVYENEPLERSFPMAFIVAEPILDKILPSIEEFVGYLSTRYQQKEILCYSYSVTRYVPRTRGGGAARAAV